jgi:hypothetical protein
MLTGVPIYYVFGNKEITKEYIHSTLKDYTKHQYPMNLLKYDGHELYIIDKLPRMSGRVLADLVLKIQNKKTIHPKWKHLKGIIILNSTCIEELKPKSSHILLNKICTVIDIADIMKGKVWFEEYYYKNNRYLTTKFKGKEMEKEE